MNIKQIVNKTSHLEDFKTAFFMCFGKSKVHNSARLDSDILLPHGGRYKDEFYSNMSDNKVKRLVKLLLQRHSHWELEFSAEGEIVRAEWPNNIKGLGGKAPRKLVKNFSRKDPKRPRSNSLRSLPVICYIKGDRASMIKDPFWTKYCVGQFQWEAMGYFLETLNYLHSNKGIHHLPFREASHKTVSGGESLIEGSSSGESVPFELSKEGLEKLVVDIVRLNNAVHPSISGPMINSIWEAQEKARKQFESLWQA